ncbi:unnamed protein product, partial [Rotaria sp. Silwood1]
MLYLYRSALTDLHRQLQQHQCQESVQVYRSQLMSMDEVKFLKQNVRQFISVNSFLSTSKQGEVAALYACDATQKADLERVRFEIKANPKVVSTKPFASISNFSQFPDEDEVLFMLGSIFYLVSVNQDDEHGWIVKMSLCSDDNNDLKVVLEDMQKQNGTGDTSLWTLGKLLWDMGKFELAEYYYQRLIGELLSNNDPSLSNLYDILGSIALQQECFEKCAQWRQKARAIRDRAQRLDSTEK